MDVVELGTTKCNSEKDSTRLSWSFEDSWDDGENCLSGCIIRMNEKKWDEACCEAKQISSTTGNLSTECIVFDAVDVQTGDSDSKDTKAVNCKGTLGNF